MTLESDLANTNIPPLGMGTKGSWNHQFVLSCS